jgi:hypothetical protein
MAWKRRVDEPRSEEEMTYRTRNPIRLVFGAARRVADTVLPFDVGGGNGHRRHDPIPPTAPPRIEEVSDRAQEAVEEVGQRAQVVIGEVAGHVTRLAGQTARVVAGTATLVREQATSLVAARREAPAHERERGDGAAAPGAGVPYEEWTKAELYERAQELDVPGRSRMSKAELIAALRAR